MKTIEMYFDLSSPYSYLAATQLPGLAQRHGAALVWKPIVLAAVFKATGNVMPAACPPKASYLFADLQRFAELYGVPFRFNSRFPVNALKAMRMIVAAEEHGKAAALSQAAFTAVWAEDRDVTTDSELRALAETVGLSADAALAAIETPAVKNRLRELTDEGLARGIFGAPAIFVGDQLFWGNDRLDFVERALAKS